MKPIFFAVALLLTAPAFAQFEDSDPRILDHYIVMMRGSTSINSVVESHPGIKVQRCLSAHMNIWLIERNTTANAEEFLSELQKDKSIKLVQFDHHFTPRSITPNDTYWGDQWNMLNTGQQSGVVGADIDATDAWDINHENVTANGDSVVIAIVDGDFDLNHEDLNFFVNYSEVPGNGIDDDGNGYIDDINGWNVDDTSGNINSTSFGAYHSTHCAGIAASIGDNGKGVAGVCWGAKIMGVNYGSTIESYVVAAYSYVYEMRWLYNNTFGSKGAYVVSTNSSFGVDGGQPADYPIWCAMYDSLGSVGVLSAAATANQNWNIDVVNDIPTGCGSKWLITVTNTTRNDVRNGGAAYGKKTIDLGAPGTGIMSTVPPSAYQTMTGTSMATPHVAGTVGALIAAACPAFLDAYAEHPDSVSLLIKDYILEGTDWNSSLNNITVSNGRLNLYHSMLDLRKFNCDSCNFDISIDKIPISCKGAADGAMAVKTSVGNAVDYSILWSNNLTSPEMLSLAPGFYTVTVTDSTGCKRFWSAELHDPDTLRINAVAVSAAVGGNPGSVTVTANGGGDSLQYSIDANNWQNTNVFSVPDNGLYTVYVRNQSGCVVSRTVLVSGVNDLAADLNFSVYPNPANDVLNVQLTLPGASDLSFTIQNVMGQTVRQTQQNFSAGTFNYSIATTELPGGTYLLRISDGNGAAIKRFEISR